MAFDFCIVGLLKVFNGYRVCRKEQLEKAQTADPVSINVLDVALAGTKCCILKAYECLQI